jgi:hypothetical protein
LTIVPNTTSDNGIDVPSAVGRDRKSVTSNPGPVTNSLISATMSLGVIKKVAALTDSPTISSELVAIKGRYNNVSDGGACKRRGNGVGDVIGLCVVSGLDAGSLKKRLRLLSLGFDKVPQELKLSLAD